MNRFFIGGILNDLWVSTSGAIALQKQVNILANNIANANTTAFKKDRATFKEHLSIYSQPHAYLDMPINEWAPEDFYKTFGAENSYVSTDGTYTDFQKGSAKFTGRDLDIYINSNSFLEILTPNGIRLTRNGSLSISKDGHLATTNGNYVLRPVANTKQEDEPIDPKSDRRIKLPKNITQLNITPDGSIWNNGSKVSQLSFVEPKDLHALTKEGNAIYIHDQTNVKLNSFPNIKQKHLEESNVSTINEMTELLKTSRNFESIKQVIKTYDQITAKAVNDIARF